LGFGLHMNDTPNLALPYILPAQAQKHVTHNEAIRAIDGLMQLAVASRTLTTPPGSPANGDRYIVSAAATGGWAGQDGKVAAYQDGAWTFYVPKEGWRAWCAAEGALLVYRAGAWSPLSSGGGDLPDALDNLTHAGINTTADATNRLSLKSPASLFDNEGAGHQQKINKHASGDTASVLYQTNYSGRAEMGLAGDDDFHFKVSPDGATWIEALKIDRYTGRVSFPVMGGPREVLTAGRAYYVRTDGLDSNTGLANTSGGAFKTIQKAIDTVAALDLSIYNATIYCGAGTRTENLVLKRTLGSGMPILEGDVATPSNCVLTVSSGQCIALDTGAVWTLRGFKLGTTGGWCVDIPQPGCHLIIDGKMEYGATPLFHFVVAVGGTLSIKAAYAISGSAYSHIFVQAGGTLFYTPGAVTLTGSPAWSNVFLNVTSGGIVSAGGITFTGAATGKRYDVSLNGVINTFGGGANFFPGNSAGSASSGGQYA